MKSRSTRRLLGLNTSAAVHNLLASLNTVFSEIKQSILRCPFCCCWGFMMRKRSYNCSFNFKDYPVARLLSAHFTALYYFIVPKVWFQGKNTTYATHLAWSGGTVGCFTKSTKTESGGAFPSIIRTPHCETVRTGGTGNLSSIHADNVGNKEWCEEGSEDGVFYGRSTAQTLIMMNSRISGFRWWENLYTWRTSPVFFFISRYRLSDAAVHTFVSG